MTDKLERIVPLEILFQNMCVGSEEIQENYQALTHLWSRALLGKPPIVQLLKNFLAFYGTRRFLTVLTSALHWSLS
jgi:hypothetical protein